MNSVDLGLFALAQIAIVSVMITLVAMLGLRKWGDVAALRRARSQSQAHFLEIRLFGDDPAQIFQSLRALLRDQARILRLLARPVLILSVPMILAFWCLSSIYGRAPLIIGHTAVISVPARADTLTVPDGIAVETSPVFIRATGGTSWRIRPAKPVSGTLEAASWTTRIVAGKGTAFLPEALPGRKSVEITYPAASVAGFPWLVWFGLFSLISAVILRKPLGVPL